MSKNISPVCRHLSSFINIFFTHISPFTMLNILKNQNPDKNSNSKQGNCKIYNAATPYYFIPYCHCLTFYLPTVYKVEFSALQD